MTSNEQIAQMKKPAIVSAEEWHQAWQEMQAKEKDHTRACDSLAAARRRRPWLEIQKKYFFEGPEGKVSLLDLFEGRRQLIVYRAFYDSNVHGWPEHACIGCSLGADQVSNLFHLHRRDTTLAYASRGSQEKIASLKQRMGWQQIPWYAITDDWDKDFGVEEWRGHNAFIRDEKDKIFRTYATIARGDEAVGTVWPYLDLTALGRQEDWEDSPEGYPQTPRYKWWRWHDAPEQDSTR